MDTARETPLTPRDDRPVKPTARTTRPRAVVGPVLLIALGVLFLLTNLGVLPAVNWLDAWRFWPLLLIALGAELLLGRRSSAGWVLLAALVVAGFTVGGQLIGLTGSGTVQGASLQDHDLLVPLAAGVTAANVDLRAGVGRYDVSAASMNSPLVSGRAQLLEGEQLDVRSDMRGGVANVRIGERSGTQLRLPVLAAPRWDVQLSPDVPVSLRLRTGVGEANADLRGLNVRQVDVDSGVGSVDLTLPETGRVRATLNGGVGRLEVRVPAGMEVRLVARAGLGGVDVDLPARRAGNTYETSGYAGARNRVDLLVKGGVGQVQISPLD